MLCGVFKSSHSLVCMVNDWSMCTTALSTLFCPWHLERSWGITWYSVSFRSYSCVRDLLSSTYESHTIMHAQAILVRVENPLSHTHRASMPSSNMRTFCSIAKGYLCTLWHFFSISPRAMREESNYSRQLEMYVIMGQKYHFRRWLIVTHGYPRKYSFEKWFNLSLVHGTEKVTAVSQTMPPNDILTNKYKPLLSPLPQARLEPLLFSASVLIDSIWKLYQKKRKNKAWLTYPTKKLCILHCVKRPERASNSLPIDRDYVDVCHNLVILDDIGRAGLASEFLWKFLYLLISD